MMLVLHTQMNRAADTHPFQSFLVATGFLLPCLFRFCFLSHCRDINRIRIEKVFHLFSRDFRHCDRDSCTSYSPRVAHRLGVLPNTGPIVYRNGLISMLVLYKKVRLAERITHISCITRFIIYLAVLITAPYQCILFDRDRILMWCESLQNAKHVYI